MSSNRHGSASRSFSEDSKPVNKRTGPKRGRPPRPKDDGTTSNEEEKGGEPSINEERGGDPSIDAEKGGDSAVEVDNEQTFQVKQDQNEIPHDERNELQPSIRPLSLAFIKEREDHILETEKQCEELAVKLSNIQSRSRDNTRSPKFTSLALKLPPEDSALKNLSIRKSDKQAPASNSLLLLRQKTNENRAVFEQRGREMTENKVKLEQLKAQLDERDNVIRDLMESQPVINASPNRSLAQSPAVPSQLSSMSPVVTYSDDLSSKESENNILRNRVFELEAAIIGLQENLLEKDSVIDARTKAIALLTDDLCRKGKSTLDQLEETKEEMRLMQNNFIAHEMEMKREKEDLFRQLDEREDRLRKLEETKDRLELQCVELSTEGVSVTEDASTAFNQLQEMRGEMDIINNKYTSFEMDVRRERSEYERQIKDKDKRLFELEDMKEKLELQCSTVEADNQATIEKVAMMQAAMERLEKDYSELQSILQRESTELNAQIEEKSARIQELEDENKGLQLLRSEQSSQEVLATVASDASAVPVPMGPESTQNLKKALSDANKQIVKLKALTKKQAKQLNSVKKGPDADATFIQLQNRIAELEEEKVSVVRSEQHVSDLESLVSSLSAQCEEHIAQLIALSDVVKEKQSLEEQLEKLQQTTNLMEEMKVRAELKAVQLEEEVDQITLQLHNLQSTVISEPTHMDTQSNDGLQECSHRNVLCELEEANNLVALLKDQLVAKETTFDNMRTQLTSLLGEGSIEDWNSNISNLQNILLQYKNDSLLLESVRNQLECTINDVAVKANNINDLSNHIATLEAQLKANECELESTAANQAKQGEKIKKLVAHLKLKKAEIKDYEDKINQLESASQEKDSFIAELQKNEHMLFMNSKQQLEESQAETARLKGVLNKTNADLLQQESKSDKLQKEFSLFTTQQDEEMHKAQDNINSLKTKLTVSEEEVDLLKIELNNKIEEIKTLDEDIKDARKLTQSSLNDLNSQLSNLQTANSQLEHDREAIINQLQSMHADLESYRTAHEISEQQLAETRNLLTHNEQAYVQLISVHETQLKEQQASISETLCDVSKYDETVRILKAENEGYMKARDDNAAQLKEQTTIIEQLGRLFNVAEAKLRDLEEIQKIRDNDIESLCLELQVVVSQVSELKAINAHALNLVDLARADEINQRSIIDPLNARLMEAEEHIQILENNLRERDSILERKAQENELLTSEVLLTKESLVAELDQLQMKFNAEIDASKSYCAMVSDLQTQITRLNNDMLEATTNFEFTLKQRNLEHDQERNELNFELKKCSDNLESMYNQFQECDGERLLLADKCERLLREKQHVEADFEEAMERCVSSIARIGELENEVSSLKSNLLTSEEFVTTFKAQMPYLDATVNNTNMLLTLYSSRMEDNLAMKDEKIWQSESSLQDEFNRSRELEHALETLKSEYENKLSAYLNDNKELQNQLHELQSRLPESVDMSQNKEVTETVVVSKTHESQAMGETWLKDVDEGWDWGSDEARLEEQHQLTQQQTRPADTRLQQQLIEYEHKVDELEWEKKKLAEELKVAQVRSGKLLMQLNNLKGKTVQVTKADELCILDQALEEEFTRRIRTLESELLAVKTVKDSITNENQHLKNRVDSMDWQIAELKDDKNRLSQMLVPKKEPQMQRTNTEENEEQPSTSFTSDVDLTRNLDTDNLLRGMFDDDSESTDSFDICRELELKLHNAKQQCEEVKVILMDREMKVTELENALYLQSGETALKAKSLEEDKSEYETIFDLYEQLKENHQTSAEALEDIEVKLRAMELEREAAVHPELTSGQEIRPSQDQNLILLTPDHAKRQQEAIRSLRTILLSKDKHILLQYHEIHNLKACLSESRNESEIKRLQNRLTIETEKVDRLEDQLLVQEREMESYRLQVVALTKELEEMQSVVKLLKSMQAPVQERDRNDDTDEIAQIKTELNLTLYLLHQKETRCDELTLELVQLLEERDMLQLRLSTSLREIEEMSRTTPAASESSPPASPLRTNAIEPPPQLPIDLVTSRTHILEEKLDQVRNVSREQRQKALQPGGIDANYTVSRDGQSQSTTLLNWFWGKSTPKVEHI